MMENGRAAMMDQDGISLRKKGWGVRSLTIPGEAKIEPTWGKKKLDSGKRGDGRVQALHCCESRWGKGDCAERSTNTLKTFGPNVENRVVCGSDINSSDSYNRIKQLGRRAG